MNRSDEIRGWLALVHRVQVDVKNLQLQAIQLDDIASWDIRQASDYLENVFEEGLKAHGEAILKEHLAASSTTSVA